MQIIKPLLSILFLFCFTCIKAQVPLSPGSGCLFNGKVYQVLIGTYNDGTPLFAGYLSPCTGTYSLPNPPWVEIGGNGSCTVWVDCSGTANSNYKKGKIGGVEVNVPIDDYMLPLTLVVAGLVFYQFRKQQLVH